VTSPKSLTVVKNNVFVLQFNEKFTVITLPTLEIKSTHYISGALDHIVSKDEDMILVTADGLLQVIIKGKLDHSMILQGPRLPLKYGHLSSTGPLHDVHVGVIDCNDQVFIGSGKVPMTKLDLDEPKSVKKISWTHDGSYLAVTCSRQVHIFIPSKSDSIFVHKCSKKASRIMDTITHPKFNRLLLCADDSKTVQAFWFN
jgi:hypothetical protein